jgi:tetratricopeptide (TPR) repeat protein
MHPATGKMRVYSPSACLAEIAALLTAGSPFEERTREILKEEPAQPELLMLLAGSQRAAGGAGGARAILEDVARTHPAIASVQFELGALLSALKEPEAAANVFSRAAALAPGYPEVWRRLGDELAKAGRSMAAKDAYAKHFAIVLREPEMLEKAAADAEGDRLTAALAARPTDVSTSLLLAQLEIRLNRFEDAERRLTETLQRAPGFAVARYTLALGLYNQRRVEDAARELDILLQDDGANVRCLNLKALCLINLGDYASAIACYELLFARDSTEAPCWAGYGHALKTVGRLDEAVAALRKAVALDPALGEAWWQLANLKTLRFTPAEVAEMRRQLANPTSTQENVAQLHFALGKALEDASEFPASFEQYAKGNAAQRQAVKYSSDNTTGLVRRSNAFFTAEFFRVREGAGCPAPDPIFIVGLTRSGSTLIEQILASHPEVEGTKELPIVSSLAAQVRRERDDASYPELLAQLSPGRLKQLGEDYVARTRVHRKLGRPRFIDKMPNNFLHVGFIHLILPNAKIIDARRNPLACGFANFKQHFTQGQEWSYDLTEIGRYYRDYIDLMDHFDALLAGRVHRVMYENLVANPEEETRALLEYCGLPFDPACLRFYENDRPVLTASAAQVRRPIFRDAVEQWRNYEPWLGPLKSALGALAGGHLEETDLK